MATPQSNAIMESGVADTRPASFQLEDVPFFPQERYQCGPAAIATVLHYSGVESATADSMVPLVYIPERQGSLQVEMLAAARQSGRVPLVIPGRLEAILEEVRAGRPVLVFQNLGLTALPQWHYAVVAGYDFESRDLILRSGTRRELRTPLRVFERTWARADHWAAVVLRPGELPVHDDPLAYIEAVNDFAGARGADAVGDAYRVASERWPDEPLVQMAHANHLYGLGRYDETADVLRRLLDRHPDLPDAHNNLAHALLRTGRAEAALPHARAAVAAGGQREATYQETLDAVQGALP
ncbi:MAG: PA2778 family cysteine peptidase [Pseudomonadota bacterium]